MTPEQIQIVTELLNSTNASPAVIAALTRAEISRIALAQCEATKMIEKETGKTFFYEAIKLPE